MRLLIYICLLAQSLFLFGQGEYNIIETKEGVTWEQAIKTPTHWNLSSFSDGVAYVSFCEDGDCEGFFIDKTGAKVISFPFATCAGCTPYYSEGLAAARDYRIGREWGYVDKTGETITGFIYETAYWNPFSEGFAAISQGGKYGYIDKTGEIVIPCQFDEAKVFSEGFAAVKKNGKWGYMHRGSSIKLQFDDVKSFSEGLAAVKKYGKWGYIDETGKIVIPCQFDDAESFSEGFAIVVKENRKYFINDKGDVKSRYMSTDITLYPFSEGFAAFKKDDKWEDKCGFLGKSKSIPAIFDDVQSFSEGFAAIHLNGKWGFIDRTGEIVIPCQFDEAESFSDGVALVSIWEYDSDLNLSSKTFYISVIK